ncbi:Binding protein, putative isoform 2 [Capsicum annuum]|nr:Binding protein, putative isoform 2 [Capsicum annuum]
MAFNLTPVGGVAALISQNGQPSNTCSSSFIMSPLPLSSTIKIPVTILGYFLVCHNQGRFLFKDQEMESLAGPRFDAGNQLIEAWNRELMCCVRDSYVKLILEMQKLRREPSTSLLEPSVARAVSLTLNAYGDQVYSFWPRSTRNLLIEQERDGNDDMSMKVSKADWGCITQQVIRPFYARLMDLPVWQLYSGNLVKAEEGMFLSQPGVGVEGGLLPATVCAFVKEHYPVFSVPWELVSEIQALGATVREIKPKMVRDLLRASSTSIILRSVDTYIDVLEYCLSDIQLLENGEPSRPDSFRDISNLDSDKECSEGHTSSFSESSSSSHRINNTLQPSSSSGGDALEMMTSLGKALFDLGRVVVEDIGRGGGPLSQRNVILGTIGDSIRDRNDQKLLAIASELRGLPCPTGTNHLTRLGATELWVGNKDQQSLMTSLAAKFLHPKVLERSILLNIFSNSTIQSLLKLQSFSLILLASHMRFLFHENWVNHVVDSNMAPWFSWENNATSASECGPSPSWIRLFWKMVDDCSDDLELFADWPLIPAFLGRPVLCRVKERKLVFIPPIVTNLDSIDLADRESGEADLSGLCLESEEIQSYSLSFKVAEKKYPWLRSLLNQFNIPMFDTSFLDCAGRCKCLPSEGKTLGQIIALKLVAAKNAGYFLELTAFPDSERDELFALFASDFSANSSGYGREELEVLRDLPIYKTVVGTYTRLQSCDLCMIPSNTFLKPFDERCLSVSADSNEKPLFRALGVPELHDQQIFVKFGLPGFHEKPQSIQEDILIYLYSNWQDLQEDSLIVEVLKETKFVRSADEMSAELFKPNDLFDPSDALLTSVFSGMRIKFPGERFISEGWLHILKKVGLHTSAESDVILECAKRVESLGRAFMPPSGLTDDLEKDLFSSQDEDWPLAWSCAPILSRQSIVPPEYSWGALNLRSPPACPTVFRHLQVIGRNNGEDTLAHWPATTGIKTIDEASFDVLKYLDRVWSSLSLSDKESLCQVAFMPAANGTRLVTASCLFTRLTINLSPFAFELPSLYLPYVNILRDLGLQDTLSISSAKTLLLNLQKACGYQRLNPNEFRAVMEIVHFICDQANTSDTSSWHSEAVVPDNDCRLVHAKSCVYIDSYGSSYIKFIDISKLRFVHQDLPEKLCIAFGVKKLSDVVIEELYCEEQLQSLECIGSVPVEAIRHKLLSRSFQAAIWTVVSSMASNVPGIDHATLEYIQSSLKLVSEKLRFVQCLHTRFVLLPKSLDISRVRQESMFPEWKDTSRHRALYFVEPSKTSVLIAEPPDYVSISEVLAIAVCRVLDFPIPLPMGSLFLCPEGSETALVDILKLSSHTQANGCLSEKDGLLGRDILPQDALLVQFHPLRPFYAGEIVAWRQQNGEKLRYGRVLENVRPSAGQALYRFKVEISLGLIELLLSSHVFSFKSVTISGEDSSADFLEGYCTMDSTRSEGVTGRVKSRPSEGNQQQQLQALQHGRVSAAELVQAVQEMLSAAGISMDVEKQSLLETTITLQEQFKDSQAALLLEQEKFDMATKEADTAKAAWLCRICLNTEVDVTIVPCGHVLCRRCSSAVSRCPFCRLQVSKVMRMFRP